MKELKVTKNHIKLLQNLHIGWESCEFGAPGVDCKRPFGNSDVFGDIAEILGIKLPDDEEDYEEYEKITDNLRKGYQELQDCLQILCQFLTIDVGTYVCEDYSYKWRRID